MSSTFRSIRGMHDILPNEISIWQELESTVRSVLASYGFNEIRVPIVERTEVFTRAIGQATDVVEKEMYSFADRNGDSLSLRPEGTAGVVRAALQNGLLYGAPMRLWYNGPMFRHERPQKGRTRQFHQVGAEVFGAPGPDVDAELLAMGERIWSALGLTDIRLEINSLGNSTERGVYRAALVEFLQDYRQDLDEASWERVERNPLRILDSKDPGVQQIVSNAPQLGEFLGSESSDFFDGLQEILQRLDINYVVNPRLVRGLDYYCHSVFEWVTDQLGAQGTICAGGRYDGLVELQGGKPWPATGFAMGVERLVALMQQREPVETHNVHAYVITSGAQAKLKGVELAEQLRTEVSGLAIICNPGDGSFKSQFKRADRSGAEIALIIAEDELEQGKVSIKYLRDGKPQESVSQETIGHWFEQWLNKPSG